MPALPNVANVAAVTARWSDSLTGHKPVCKWHYQFSGLANISDLISWANAIFAILGGSYMAQCDNTLTLTEIDVLDLTTPTGNLGISTTAPVTGTGGGAATPSQVAMQCNLKIARHYRGGKPKIFLPGLGQATYGDDRTWSVAAQGSVNNNTLKPLFVVAGTVIGAVFGSTTCLNACNVSYYHGFTNFVDSSGRNDSKPTLRPTPLVDAIVGATVRPMFATQRRRLQPS